MDFEKKLKLFILSRIPDEAIAADILQEVFIRVHLKIDTLNDRTKISSWIYRITHNLIVDHFRSHKKEIASNQDIPEVENGDPETNLMGEALEDMVRMMDDLPKEYCEALCMTEIQGLSQKEYAQRTGISYTAAKTRAFRARKMLKDMLMNCCHYEFDKYGTVLQITQHQCCCCHPRQS
jgi:RNA polymerase sigma-70 factor (ECF subfamily)